VGQVLKLPATGTAPSATQRAASAPAPSPSAARPTPTPAADNHKTALKPAAASSSEGLQQRVIADARRVGGNNMHLGIAAKNLVTGDRIAVNAADEFPSASVMKLPILL